MLPPAELLTKIEAEKARRAGRRDFAAFVLQAWDLVPQVNPLVWNWHVDVICRHLEEVAHGRISNLLINIPPGHAKSVILCVLFPAWIWTWWPKCQFLFASYSKGFATRDSVRCRTVIESDWYQETYARPSGWELSADQNVKDNYTNTAGGQRQAIGVGGSGLRAHIIGIDDPIDAVDIHSEAKRNAVNDWISQTLSQRWVDAREQRQVTIMQRLSDNDPSDFILQSGDVVHLRLPSEADPAKPCITHHVVKVPANDNQPEHLERREFWRDPRTIPGEPLFPQKFPPEVLDAWKKPGKLGVDGFNTQHNQDPTSGAGGMFPRECWRFWKPDGRAPDHTAARPRKCYTGPAMPLPMRLDKWVISVDAAFKDNPSGSQVAIHVWASSGGDRFLMYRYTHHMDFSTTKSNLRVVCATYPQALIKLIEDAANGAAIINDLKHEIAGFIPVTPEGGKEARAAATQPYQRSGNIYLPDGAPWLEEYVSIFAAFPKGKRKDDVDAQSQALRELESDDEGEVGKVNWGRR